MPSVMSLDYSCLPLLLLGYFILSGCGFELERQPEDSEVSSGKPVRLGCGNIPPGAVVRWNRDGMAVQLSSRVYVEDGDLVITRVMKEDAGRYICSVVNITTGTSFSSKPAILTVNYDVVWIASSEEELVLMINQLKGKSSLHGLILNPQKTIIMTNGPSETIRHRGNKKMESRIGE
nr:tyrosine-protein kinase-like otk [Halyomorpha halys]